MLKNKNLKFVAGKKLKKLSKIIVGTLATLTLTSFFAVAPSVFASGRPMASYSQENFLCDSKSKTIKITITDKFSFDDAKLLKEKFFNKNNPEKWSLVIAKNSQVCKFMFNEIVINGNLTIENGVTINPYAFWGATINENLIIEENIKADEWAFDHAQINNLIIQDSSNISKDCFNKAVIKGRVIYPESYTFEDTKFCEDVILNGKPYIEWLEQKLKSSEVKIKDKTVTVSGVLNIKDAEELIREFFDKNNSKWSLILEGNAKIEKNAFYYSKIDNLIIKDNATVDDWAFYYTQINNLTVQNKAAIKPYVFNVSQINNLIIESNVIINPYAFFWIYVNEDVIIKNNVEINCNAFNLAKINNLKIHDSVIIKKGAFSDADINYNCKYTN